ncbi:MAG: hypothetical protein IPM55_22120 [Acidobacteria bacterium]|nr:hypothetical protein [Acidobacteriota bacterium]
MAMTLVEAAKSERDPLRSGVIQLYAENSEILRALPFDSIQGSAMRYNREETLPGVGFRGVNEAYSEDVGVINPVTEPLVIAGGDLDVDKFILQTMGMDQRSVREAMKVKAIAHRWTKAFLKGDSASDPREFDGLQVRLTGSQLISAGSTSGGTALSLVKLDELIDAVDNPTHLIMNRSMRRRITAAARTSTVGGYVTYSQDEFGRQVTKYNDLPILIADQDNDGAEILQFNETASAGGATATSIYCVSLREGMLTGIQNGGMMVTDLGELQTKPVFRTRVEWYAGVALFHAKAAARLWTIGDLAAVA